MEKNNEIRIVRIEQKDKNNINIIILDVDSKKLYCCNVFNASIVPEKSNNWVIHEPIVDFQEQIEPELKKELRF